MQKPSSVSWKKVLKAFSTISTQIVLLLKIIVRYTIYCTQKSENILQLFLQYAIIPSLTAQQQKKTQNPSKQAAFSIFFAFHDK